MFILIEFILGYELLMGYFSPAMYLQPPNYNF
jgi:hypothetical protein